MIWQSLRIRLFVMAAFSIVGALFLYWSVLNQVFERHVVSRLNKELEGHLNQLITRLEISGDGEVDVPQPPQNPRFLRPFGGLYWQVEIENGDSFGSRSLWDQSIAIPNSGKLPGEIAYHRDVASNNGALIAVERTVLMKTGDVDRPIRLLVAMDQKDLDQAMEAFDADTFLIIALLAVFLMAAASAQILVGLRPLNTLRNRLNVVASGSKDVLDDRFPTEVRPLVEELNELLAERGEMVERARASASDLAHGLKTPLAILSAEGRTLAENGQTEPAGEIQRQVGIMNNQIERQLARARVRGRSRVLDEGISLRPACEKLVKAFRQMPRGEEIEWIIDVPEGLSAGIDTMDFEEIVGNILDNARKWAADRIRISVAASGRELELVVEDNGPGISETDIDRVMKRGGRVDRNAPGSGLGLSIVRDILEIYNCRMRLAPAEPCGLRLVLTLPVAESAAGDEPAVSR